MIDSYFRKRWQRLLFDPFAETCVRLGILPHHLTYSALILGLLTLPALYFKERIIALILILASGLLDAVDGTLARKLKLSSNKGAIMDVAFDRAVEASVVIGLYLYDPMNRGFLCLLLLSSFYLCITTFLLSGIFYANSSYKSFHYSAGIIERTEVFIFFPVVILFDSVFFWASIIFSLLVFITTLLRFSQMLKEHH